ncbi:MAG: hypothetical protein EBU84_18445, partial [Actinobacteria bacterium]|nr:hypothetical protein [Actinomycetota bacterium]
YYTPIPVVRFMVRAVHDVLRNRFNLPDGIISEATWGEVCASLGVQLPEGLDGGERFVQMIDPATGTGTFLLEWIRESRRLFEATGRKDWGEFLRNVTVPSMAAFEISLASYAVAHLKLALEIQASLNTSAEIQVFLSNTMQPSDKSVTAELFSDPIADEAARAAAVKDSGQYSIIIGNPPYKDKSKGMGRVVEARLRPSGALLDNFTPHPSRKLGAHTKILRNLYVFFWRWALDKVHGTPQQRPGIVAFITSFAWLRGPVFETMREWIRDGNDVWVVDLGGDIKSGEEGDENVFSQITTGTAICIVCRTDGGQGQLRYKLLRGARSTKLAWLEGGRIESDGWLTLDSDPREPIGPEKSTAWLSYPSLGDLMPFQANGIHQQRTWVNDGTKSVLVDRWKKLASARVASRPTLMKETSSRKVDATGRDLSTGSPLGPLNDRINSEPVSIVRYSFRTLDRQWLLADSRVIDRPSPELWAVRGPRQIFFSELHSHPVGVGPAITVAGFIPNLD